MLKLSKLLFNRSLVTKSLINSFGAHHEINRDEIILRNDKSGIYIF